MNTKTLPVRRGFTLLEVLMVVVIIFILAALLLPVVEKARSRSRQAQCVSQMRQMGLGYQGFAHEHGDQFPFQVPTNQGGTLEFVQAGERLGGGIQFAYRHFQPLSNELQVTKLLVCPADWRSPAATFAELQNQNVSFFAGVTAEYSKPDSILAGDGNIAGEGEAGAILHLGGPRTAYWTQAGHSGRGNLLFSDGHVEQTTKAGLNYALGQQTGPVSAWLPVGFSSASAGTSPSSSSSSPPSTPQQNGGGGGGAAANNSGFAALQNFFQAPSSPSTPSAPPAPVASTPPATTVPANPPVVAPPPLQPILPATPQVAAKPATNRPPLAAEKAQELAAAEPGPTAEGQMPVNMFMVFVKPERCWYCWLIILVLGLATAFLLGMEIRRRRACHQDQPQALPGRG